MKVAEKDASTHSLNKRQLEIGKFHNAAKRILEQFPEAFGDVEILVSVYGHLVDDVYFEGKGTSIADVMLTLLNAED